MSETMSYTEPESAKDARLPRVFDAYLKDLERAEKEGTRRPYMDGDFMPTMRRASALLNRRPPAIDREPRPAAPVDVEKVREHLCNTCGFCPCKARNKVAGSRITHCKEYYNCHTPAKGKGDTNE